MTHNPTWPNPWWPHLKYLIKRTHGAGSHFKNRPVLFFGSSINLLNSNMIWSIYFFGLYESYPQLSDPTWIYFMTCIFWYSLVCINLFQIWYFLDSHCQPHSFFSPSRSMASPTLDSIFILNPHHHWLKGLLHLSQPPESPSLVGHLSFFVRN